MTKYIAKPLINNNRGLQEFNTIKEAVTYLNTFLLDEMPTLHADDYFLIGKLWADDGSTDWVTPVKPVGRPTKTTTTTTTTTKRKINDQPA